ncbi:hypothetical protein [Aureivirga marina]|nr:hypothetical protein [Aureivirga marina]
MKVSFFGSFFGQAKNEQEHELNKITKFSVLLEIVLEFDNSIFKK